MDNTRKKVLLIDIVNMSWANFETWFHSPRTIIMLFFVFSECFMLMKGLDRMMMTYFEGARMHLMEMLAYRISEGCNLPVMSTLLLVTINEMPRNIRFQYYSAIRSNKRKWLSSQIVYCLMLSLFMMLIIIVFMLICAIPLAEPGYGWSDIERIEMGKSDWEQTIVNQFLIKNFSPHQAVVFCTIPVILFWFTMMLVILLFGLFGFSSFGVIIYMFMLVSNIILLIDVFGFFNFPIAYATFLRIGDENGGNEVLTLFNVFCGYLIIIGLIVLTMNYLIYKIDFNLYTENKR